MAERPLGYLVINILESAGHDSEDQPVWEPEFKHGYARGGPTSAASLWGGVEAGGLLLGASWFTRLNGWRGRGRSAAGAPARFPAVERRQN